MTNELDEKITDLPFRNSDLPVEERVDDLLSRMTLDDKIRITTGKYIYMVKPIKRLGIPKFKTTDGPHGVGTGIFFLKKMTYFPVAICRTATWNPQLSQDFGSALADETRSVGRQIILAPGINIQRTPLCGRNFEYQTEDPYLNSRTAVQVVKGIQSKKISCCVKHFAANNQEYNRFKIDTQVSERALEELYYPAFKATVEEADAWSFMACYNKLNGGFGCENYELVREKLINEWGFKGFLVSDWLATRYTTTVGCIKAGLSLEMPFSKCYKPKKIKAALQNKEITEADLDDVVRRLLRIFILTGLLDDPSEVPLGSRCTPEHFAIAKKVAEEGIVLLKNENEILPLDSTKIKKLAVIGPKADAKNSFGGGSGSVRAKYEITPLKGLKTKCKENRIKLVKKAEKADAVIVVVGLGHGKYLDSENNDRLILELSKEQEDLIKQTVEKNQNTIVVVITGSPIGMEAWEKDIPAIVQGWYSGSEGGNAMANILFGDVNPSGKLPITFPKKIHDSPAHKSFRTYPGLKEWDTIKEGDIQALKKNTGMIIKSADKVHYDEGIFVGYRYFDINDVEPLFPFGHGLSYTTFKYENLKLNKPKISGEEELIISVEIKNTGKRAGSEVVQLYIQDVECSVERPLKELKGFQKVFLEPNESKTVEFKINKQALMFYDEKSHDWKVETGAFILHVGSSSRDIRLEGKLEYA